MTSARTQCPECRGARVAALNAILFAPNADFFRCEECGYLWHVQKGQDGPASRSLLEQAASIRRRPCRLENQVVRGRITAHSATSGALPSPLITRPKQRSMQRYS